MSEINFAKSFLTTVDSRNTKYQPDHVFDPKTFQMRVPYTLPRLSHPPHPLPPKAAAAGPPPPGSESATTATIILRSTRNPVLSLTLPSLSTSSTTIIQLKESVQSTLGGPSAVALEKIKILYNKKPIPASKKTIAEAIDGGVPTGQDIELGVMVMGGAADPPPPPSPAPEPVADPTTKPSIPEAAAASAVVPPPMDVPEPAEPMEGIEKVTIPPPAQGPSAKDILATEEFWDDLQGFLEQRLKDQNEAATLRAMLRKAWRVDG